MKSKFSTAPILNPSGEPTEFNPKRGENAAILQNFARFGMLGQTELCVLHPLHPRWLYNVIAVAKADNNAYIKHVDWQQKRAKRMVAGVDLFFELATNGERFNETKSVPDYDPPAGSDFEH